MIRTASTFVLLLSLVTLGAAQAPSSPSGFLYLAGYLSNNVGEYQPDGTLIRTLSVPGLVAPRGIAFDDAGDLIVACEGNSLFSSRILRLDLSGQLLQTIQHPLLTSAAGIARTSNGRWFVGNFNPGRVLVFDDQWLHVATLTNPGLGGVCSLVVESNDIVTATSSTSNAIVSFDSSGAWLSTVTHPTFNAIASTVIDPQGYRYVANAGANTVAFFDPGWNYLTSFGTPFLAGPQGLAFDAAGNLLVTNYWIGTVHRFSSTGQMLGTMLASGVNTARTLAFQTGRLALARGGGVNLGAGSLVRPLTINGSSGDAFGRITLGISQPATLALYAPPQGPASAAFVLWAVAGETTLADVEALPAGLSWFSFPTPLAGAAPTTLVNSIGAPTILGFGTLGHLTAPATILTLPSGAGLSLVATIQGFVMDLGSRTAPSLPVSPTNALVVTIL